MSKFKLKIYINGNLNIQIHDATRQNHVVLSGLIAIPLPIIFNRMKTVRRED
jgi:hypothetical protein